MKLQNFIYLAVFLWRPAMAQEMQYNSPGAGNPIIPGYFADPTVKKFGDYYYIYATTDGTGWGTGPSQVWFSKDFVNWTLTEMNWPTTEVYWAPDVWQAEDGRYYLYYSQPVQLHGGVAATPFGPWRELTADGSPIVPNRYVSMSITLDGQSFLDDDGSRYLYWGTWGIYKDHGAGWGRFNSDMKSFADTSLIPNTQITDFFEGPFMIKRSGIYYLTYSSGSCHDETYRVQYVMSKEGPTSGFVFAENNPILSTNADGSVHGPGHHSILQEGDNYYIVYHRHDNPHSSNGFHRQIAIDKLGFDDQGLIKKVVPTHTGVGYLGKNTNPFENVLYGKPFKASSEYSSDFKADFANDNNNGTLWMPSPNDLQPSIAVDMGEVKHIQRTRVAFHYGTHYFQYLIEYSLDGKKWEVFTDKRSNVQPGSPMTDYNDVQARHLRLTITGVERQGFPKAVWEFKAFEGFQEDPAQELIHLQASDLAAGSVTWANNRGMYAGQVSLGGSGATAAEGTVRIPNSLTGLRAPLKTNRDMDYTAIVSWMKAGNRGFAALQWDAKTQRFAKEIINTGTASKSIRKSLESLLAQGTVQFADPVVSIRVFNRKLHASEIEYYAFEEISSPQAPAVTPAGLLVDIDPRALQVGQQTKQLTNKGKAGGTFVAIADGPTVDIVAGRKALIFEKGQELKSDIPTPKSLGGNNPYTVAAWVLNAEVAPVESIFEWAPGGHQILTAGRFQYGTNTQQGASYHMDWADMGYAGGVPTEGNWHHIVLVFDGYMERVYVDGQLNASEQKWLFMVPGEHMVLGGASASSASFSGALAGLQVYDQAWDEDRIQQAYTSSKDDSDILLYLAPRDLLFGETREWISQGSVAGAFTTANGPPAMVKQVDGYLALNSMKTTLRWQSELVAPNAPTFTVHLHVYVKGRWQLFSLVRSADGEEYFIDGEKSNDMGIFKAFGLAGRSDWSRLIIPQDVVLSSLMLRSGALSGKAIYQYYNTYYAEAQPTSQGKFASVPRALSSVAAWMQAERSSTNGPVSFLFIRDGRAVSSWQSSAEFLDHTLKPGGAYHYQFLIRDVQGRILQSSPIAEVRTDAQSYSERFLEFSQSIDLLHGRAQSVFDGVYRAFPEKTGAIGITIQDGELRMSSQSAGWDGPLKRGAFVYQEVAGDFVAEVELVDCAGLETQQGVRFNDPSLMVVLPSSMDSLDWDFVSLSFFPLYNQGNMITNRKGQQMYQVSNMTGWSAHKFLQMERRGNELILRTSKDGVVWQQMPGSPIYREDFEGQKLFIGLGHVTHSDSEGYVVFDNFRVSTPK